MALTNCAYETPETCLGLPSSTGMGMANSFIQVSIAGQTRKTAVKRGTGTVESRSDGHAFCPEWIIESPAPFTCCLPTVNLYLVPVFSESNLQRANGVQGLEPQAFPGARRGFDCRGLLSWYSTCIPRDSSLRGDGGRSSGEQPWPSSAADCANSPFCCI